MKKIYIKTLILGILSALIISSTPVLAADRGSSVNSKTQLASSKSIEKTSNTSYIRYTYETAPQDIKEEHEENSKSLNRVANPEDIIFVPVDLNLKNNSDMNFTAKSYSNLLLGYEPNLRFLNAWNLGGTESYYAFIDRDYVGYNFITSGQAVLCLQVILNELGYNVVVDGYFGPKTQAAVTSFQRSNGLLADGITGPNTWNTMVWIWSNKL
jgi:hypothetical protein